MKKSYLFASAGIALTTISILLLLKKRKQKKFESRYHQTDISRN